ncbi:hypothetical protein [Microbacterium jejuense]|uniref:hypothetical protein n=1 Tax=Microbacterium jejuense TaxID=1263637 RepID=UPI0031E575FD
MADNTWPLKNRLPEGHQFFTTSDVIEFLSGFDDDTPVWIDNYWQPVRQITQRPLDLIAAGSDGIHFG